MKADHTKLEKEAASATKPRRTRKKTEDSFQGLGIDVDAEADSHTLPSSEKIHSRALSTDVIAQRAYEIWEREGCPHGKSDEHWRQAEQELTSR